MSSDALIYAEVLLKAAWTTIFLSFLALVFGAIGGTIVGLLRTSHHRTLRLAALAYTEFFRSLPILIVMFFCYYGAPLVLGIDLSTFWAATLALSLSASSLMSEVVRAGIESVRRGQWEAAYSQGMRYWGVMRYIVAPQAIRVILPPSVGVYIATLKESSLASIIGYVELTKRGLLIWETTFGSFWPLIAIAVLYFLINYCISLGGGALERRFALKTSH